MIRQVVLSIALAVIPRHAVADVLARYEAAMERGSANINGFLLGRIPDLAGVVPSSDWQEVDREIGRCVLGRIGDAGGDAATEAHVRQFEGIAARPITSYAAFVDLLTAPVSGSALAAMQACGQDERAMRITVESGMAEVLAAPENQRLLMTD